MAARPHGYIKTQIIKPNIMYFAWNIRGLNSSTRQTITKEWINIHRPLFGAFLKTHIREVNSRKISNATPFGWKSYADFDYHNSARIVVVWDPRISMVVYQASAQLVTCGVFLPAGNVSLTISFAYGFNQVEQIRSLWDELRQIDTTSPVSSHPWAVVGDFNQILRVWQHSNHLTQDIDTAGMDEMNKALQDAELFEAQSKGLTYTWWNSGDESTFSKKIDHALINQHWADSYPDAFAEFMDPKQSDHSPCWFNVPSLKCSFCKPFQFFQHVVDHPEYAEAVSKAWQRDMTVGSRQFKLARSLKALKPVLRRLNKNHYSGITRRVKAEEEKLANLHRLLLINLSPELAKEEHSVRAKWKLLCAAEEKFYRQRSRVKWLHLADRNTTFFHKTVTL